jgi:fumarate hydratase class II
MRDLVVLMVEQAETVIFNGGELGGLIKIEELKKSLDSLKQYCEDLKTAVAQGLTAVGVGTAASGTVGAQAFNQLMTGKSITIEEMEDEMIKH